MVTLIKLRNRALKRLGTIIYKKEKGVMNMIKLIAIDLDGTLLTNDKTISERNQVILKKAKEQGVKVVLCTGRPLNSVVGHLETLGLNDEGDYAVTFNGGLIQRNDTGEIVAKEVMSYEDAKTLYELTYPLGLPLDVVQGSTVMTVQPEPEENQSLYYTLNPLLNYVDTNLAELKEKSDFNKMVCTLEPAIIEEKMPLIPASYHEHYNIVRSGEYIFEFLPKKVSKAYGLKLLGELLNIKPEEMMALGDEENDLAMIEYVGLGVAMANGSQQIKEAAQYVTLTNEEDGVAHAVEKFVLA